MDDDISLDSEDREAMERAEFTEEEAIAFKGVRDNREFRSGMDLLALRKISRDFFEKKISAKFFKEAIAFKGVGSTTIR
jgi:hypothetical protein